MADELRESYWVHPDTPDRCHLREDEPGIYRISAEVMHRMMRDLGWTPVEADPDV